MHVPSENMAPFFWGGGEEEEITLENECTQAIVITLIFINIFIGE